jgi:hypothetical protein
VKHAGDRRGRFVFTYRDERPGRRTSVAAHFNILTPWRWRATWREFREVIRDAP